MKAHSKKCKRIYPIRIWQFRDAPLKYRKLSRNGGDEDWLAVVPKKSVYERNVWFLECEHFGCALVHSIKIKNKVVFIGCHA